MNKDYNMNKTFIKLLMYFYAGVLHLCHKNDEEQLPL